MMATAFQGKKFLIVEDDPDFITALTALLDNTGAEVRTAFDGNQALDAQTEFDPDLIVLDAMLPKRSGFLVLEKIKGNNQKRGQRPFIIMITGNEGKRHQQWAESLGVDGYFHKPFRMERLVDSMTKLLSN